MNRYSSLALTGCALISLLGVSACGGEPATPAPAPVSATAAAVFGGTDLAWIEITVAMDEQLLPLLDLAPTNSSGPAAKSLFAEVKALHEDELTNLRALHTEAGLPAENQHKGMPMPGMVTPEQVAEAAPLKGAEFDTFVAEKLKAHFDQGVNLAGSEGKAGVEPRTRALAEKVISSRRTYLARLGEIS
ncbi:DUF305 domain-containing protein [Actinoplanes sp. NPDC051494]|uniref:DUF305 domain-containing protein n=1 Tax=Actinoplanes sp. NPDC051494 TaxID=3363907 RepID=UPI00378BC4EF